MRKTIDSKCSGFLRGVNGSKNKVTLFDIKNIQSIQVRILSGAEVITVTYASGEKKLYGRTVDFPVCHGEYNLPVNEIENFLSYVGTSYDAMRNFAYLSNPKEKKRA